jgi:hypothetical protein
LSKTGRNEKCPCGSGNKYKYCCGGPDGNILSFPEIPTGEELKNIPEGMSWQESRGTPNPATDVLHQLEREMGDVEFSSLDEANNFIREMTERRNQTGLDDFMGISPSLMHNISSFPLSENQEFLSLTGEVSEDDIPRIPMLRQTLWLLNHLKTDGQVKLTTAEYLPPSLAVSWFDEAFLPYTDESTLEIRPVRRESDEPRMVWVRDILKSLKLLFIRKGRLGISTKGKAFLNAPASNQYQQLFYFLADVWDWSAYIYSGFEISPFHQKSLPFFLHVLRKQGADGLTEKDIKRIYSAAFPYIFDTVEDDSFIYYLALSEPAQNFTEPLGLSETRKLDSVREQVVPTELFRRALHWGP